MASESDFRSLFSVFIPKILPPSDNTQIYGIVESIYCRRLCSFAAVDINSLGSVYAFVSEQDGNILNRYAVVVENSQTILEIKSLITTDKEALFPTVYSERELNQYKQLFSLMD